MPQEHQVRPADRRAVRTRRALRDALVAEMGQAAGLDHVAVTSLAERAGVTRRTFYLHFRDIPDLVEQCEAELLEGLRGHIATISASHLEELEANLASLQPCPGSVELLRYVAENGDFMAALLGPGGDPAFVERFKRLATDAIRPRALEGISGGALGTFFDYYLAFAVSAIVGVIQKWLEGGMAEPPELMARAVTLLMFVRPGDLYGRPVDIDIPRFMNVFSQLRLVESLKETA